LLLLRSLLLLQGEGRWLGKGRAAAAATCHKATKAAHPQGLFAAAPSPAGNHWAPRPANCGAHHAPQATTLQELLLLLQGGTVLRVQERI